MLGRKFYRTVPDFWEVVEHFHEQLPALLPLRAEPLDLRPLPALVWKCMETVRAAELQVK